MKEVTREITAKVTIIETMTDEDADSVVLARKEAEKNVKNDLRKIYGADNVNVEIRDFVRDV